MLVMEKVVFLASPRKNSNLEGVDLNESLADRIEETGFRCIYAARDTDQKMSPQHIFQTNLTYIQQADIFIAVLKNYTKNLSWEVGYANARKECRENPKVVIGLDFGEINPDDLMLLESFDKIIKPDELETELEKYK